MDRGQVTGLIQRGGRNLEFPEETDKGQGKHASSTERLQLCSTIKSHQYNDNQSSEKQHYKATPRPS